jgi:hypothetical protein
MTSNPDYSSFLARCERVERERKAREDRALYLSIIGTKSRSQSNRQAIRKECRGVDRGRVHGRGHETRNPYWGDGPFNVVRPGRHKKRES